MRKWFFLLSGCLCLCIAALAQEPADTTKIPENAPVVVKKVVGWLKTDNDTNYIEDHTQDVVVRLFGSRKYNYYDVVDQKRKQELFYRPNRPFNIGVGVNYKFIALNLGFNFPFINKNEKYGKTSGVDLQTHLYARRMVIDFYGQFYKGYYVSDSKGFRNFYTSPNQDVAYIRPDIKNLTLGLGVQYIFNQKRFSYRAAYLQNEYQKKSAGSFIVGAEVFGVRMKADSSFIPFYLSKEDFFDNKHFDRTGIVSGAVNAGYAYTLVLNKHFFVTLALTGSLGVNYSTLDLTTENSKITKVGLQLNNSERISIGYNSSRYFAGIHYVNLTTRSTSPVSNTYQRIGAGDFRVSIARRFKLKKKLF
jgi:hypothetical protein